MQPVLEEHIQTFLPKFLQLTRFQDSLVSHKLEPLTSMLKK
jgi:hypothetical protein